MVQHSTKIWVGRNRLNVLLGIILGKCGMVRVFHYDRIVRFSEMKGRFTDYRLQSQRGFVKINIGLFVIYSHSNSICLIRMFNENARHREISQSQSSPV